MLCFRGEAVVPDESLGDGVSLAWTAYKTTFRRTLQFRLEQYDYLTIREIGLLRPVVDDRYGGESRRTTG